jgi:cupin fold WbuC family metalloprotein
MKLIKQNDEIFYAEGPIIRVGSDEIDFLKARATENPRGMARLCAHPGVDDALHEMLIVLSRACCIPPHKHLGKSESFHLVEGKLTVVIFTDEGKVREVIPMAPPGSGEMFFYRLSEALYHTVVPMSEFVVFHETTNGPFRREDMQFAVWAPGEDAPREDREAFVQELIQQFP